MKKIVTTLVLAVAVLRPGSLWAADLTWQGRASLSAVRYNLGVAAPSNGKVYAIGGLNASGTPVGTNDEYDPSNNTWTNRANMPTARWTLGVAAATNGKVYAIGGFSNTGGDNLIGYHRTVEEYNPATNTWTTKTSMPTPRSMLGVAAAGNGKVYAIGGRGPVGDIVLGQYHRTVEEYDPATNTWLSRASMPTARLGLGVAAATNGKVYAIGGVSASPTTGIVNTTGIVEEYDPATNTWTNCGSGCASMPTPRDSLAVVAGSNGRIYAIGGENASGTPVATVEEYDPATNTWTPRTNMPTPRRELGAAQASNGKIYAAGGLNFITGAVATVEEATVPASVAVIEITESIVVNDSPQIIPPAIIDVSESIAVSDTSTVLPPAIINVSESIAVNDSVQVLPPAVISVNESIGVSDAPTITAVVNTPTGTNILAQPVDTTTGTSPVALTFSNVTQGGVTNVTTSNSGSPPPSGFKLGNPPKFYDLTTTALFSGEVKVCINYSGISFNDASKLKLFHLEGGVWVDRTVSLDTVGKIICASVTSLSPFSVFEPANSAPVLNNTVTMTLTAINEDNVSSAGNTVSAILATGAGGNPISDLDSGALRGIAVTAVDNSNGAWQYSTDSGTNWTAFGAVAVATARLLTDDATNKIRFVPNANFNGTATISLRAWDRTSGVNGATADTTTNGGSTAFSTVVGTAQIAINAVNDAPVLNAAVTMTLTAINEDNVTSAGNTVAAILATGAGGNPISDLDSGALRGIAVTAVDNSNGAWQYSTDSGTNWTAFGAVSTTVARLSTDDATNKIRFVPNANFNGAATISLRAWDRTSGTNGGTADTTTNGAATAFSTALGTAQIAVNAVNDPPVNTVPGPQVTNEDTALAFSSVNGNQISIADVDAGSSPVQMTLTVTNGTLTLSGTTGLTFTVGDGTADLTMTFTGTIANINTALNGLSFTPTANFDGPATLTIATNDLGNTGSGGPQSDIDTVSITVNAVNDAPVLNTTVTMTLTAINEDDVTSAGNTVAAILATGAGGNPISDVDSGALRGIAVTAVDNSNGAWQYSTDSGTNWTAFGAVAAATARLLTDDATNKIRFVPNANFNGTGTISLRAWDRTSGVNGATADTTTNGGTTAFSSAVGTTQITVNPVNDPPVNTVPGPQVINEDTALVFSSANSNQISVADVDAGSNPVQVTLSVTNGTLTLGGTAGLTFTSGANATSAMTFTGTIAAINTALNSLSFAPTLNYNGPASLTITTNDQGYTGSGGPLSDTDTVSITVNAVNDPPSFTKGPNQTVNEDSGPQNIANWATAISPGPPDESGQVLTFMVTNNINPGLFSASPAVSSNGTLTYTPAPDANGTATITLVLKDNGGTANGGQDTSPAQTFTIIVTEVNDPPTAANDNKTTLEDTPLIFPASDLTANDSKGAPNESSQVLTVTAVSPTANTNGTVTLSGGNITYTPAPNFNGTASFTYTIQDNGTTNSTPDPKTATGMVTVTVTPVNDAPAANAGGPYTVNEGGTVPLTGTGSDVDVGDTLTYAWDLDGNGTFETLGQNVTFSAAALDGSSTKTVVLRVTDPGGLSATSTATINVENVPPTITVSGNTTVNEGNPMLLNVSAPDAGAPDVVTLAASGLPAGATFTQTPGNPATGTLSWTPAYTQAGSYPGVTITATDDDGGAATSIFTLTVNEAGQPVIAVTNSNDRTVSIIDAQTNQVVGTEAVGKKPVAASFFDVFFTPSVPPAILYVAERDTDKDIDKADDEDDASDKGKGAVHVLVGSAGPSFANPYDLSFDTVVQVGNRPEGLAIRPDGSEIWTANRNDDSISIIDRVTEKVIATVSLKITTPPTGKGKAKETEIGRKPVALAFSPDGQFVYVVGRNSNNLIVVNAATRAILSSVEVGNKPASLAVSPDGARLYVADRNGGNVAIVGLAIPGSPVLLSKVAVGGKPEGLALLPNGSKLGSKLYVTDGEANSVVVFDVISGSPYLALRSIVPVGLSPMGLAVTKPGSFIDGDYLYVANREDNTVSVIDTTNDTVFAVIPVGKGPKGVAAGIIPTAP